MLNILFFIPWITKSMGGTENVGHLMANAMSKKGHNIHIVTFDDTNNAPKFTLEPNIKIHHINENNDITTDSKMLFTVAEISPDIIVGLHMNRTFLRYVICSLKLNIPLILSEHIDPRFPRMIGTFTKTERDIAFSGATKIHLLSDIYINTIPDFLRDKVSVIPNTVKPAFRKANPENGDKCNILITSSRLVKRKNISQLIYSFSLIASDFNNWKLQILGDGDEKHLLIELRNRLNLNQQIEFVGNVSNPYNYLSKAQCYISSSLFEGFPLSSLEAMAHGLPLIGFRACNGINEQILHLHNGILVDDSTSKNGLAEAMKNIFNNPGLRKSMGNASLKRYNELYSNSIIESKWEKMIYDTYNNFTPRKRISYSEYLNAKLEDIISKPYNKDTYT